MSEDYFVCRCSTCHSTMAEEHVNYTHTDDGRMMLWTCPFCGEDYNSTTTSSRRWIRTLVRVPHRGVKE